jgi:hypothetical protein
VTALGGGSLAAGTAVGPRHAAIGRTMGRMIAHRSSLEDPLACRPHAWHGKDADWTNVMRVED